ncbi:MAG: desulfoferrodoxin family protein [Desulfitobacteriia bacterium]|jgi:superoxide reductase
MKAEVVFFKCEICGNMVGLIKNGGGKLVCCDEPMLKLEANTENASREKHIPVAVRKGSQICVEVGSEVHPMTEEHLIEWIAVVGEEGTERISLGSGQEPKATFCDKKNADVYAYCNLHGLWKSTI